MSDNQNVTFVDNRIVVVKLIPPFEAPEEPCATFHTDNVEYAIRLYRMSHALRPKVVWQDFTNNTIYIPEAGGEHD